MRIASRVPLGPLSTLELGGPARYLVRAKDEPGVLGALAWARARGLPAAILGGGSNLVVADEGFPGLVIHMAQRGLSLRAAGERILVTAQAGEPFDPLVALSVAQGLAGLECLSGIPGLVGATPIQNVGAYGQEVAETIVSVRVCDRQSRALSVAELAPAACGFGYRESVFKRDPDRYVVLAVTFALWPPGARPPALRYPELLRAVEAQGPTGAPPSLMGVRETVLGLRRRKSMVIDPEDENRRSVGSFFMNPVVSPEVAAGVVERALFLGVAGDPDEVPRYPAAGGQVKLAAGWLIERAGVRKGERHGHVGVSSRHALALVHHGGGSSAELVALARRVRAAVQERFGVTLVPEPVFLGFSTPF